MIITVKDVIALDEFKGSIVVAGLKGIDNIVNNALLMEVPDIFPYVCQNNLLITTLYPIYEDLDAMNKLIPKLAELNLAGICIKPARYVKDIPEIMINQANELNFPIIQLPENSNLSFMVNSILELSLNRHISVLSFRSHVHERLMNLFLTGAGINELINNLSKMVRKPIILLDNYMNISYKSEDLRNTEIVINSYNNTIDTIILKANNYIYNNSMYISHAITAGKTKFGYLLLLDCNSEDQNLVMAIEQGSLLIASAFYKDNAVFEKERSFQSSFIREILNGKITSQMETINRARSFGWALEFPQVIMVIKVIDEVEERKLQIYEEIIDSRLESILAQKLFINNDKIKIVYMDDSLVIFISCIFMKNVKTESIKAGEMIIDLFKTTNDISIGISNTIFNIDGFPQGYDEAHNSAMVGSILNNSTYVSHYDDYQIFSVLREVKDEKVLKNYVKDKIGIVIDYDIAAGTNLLETMKVLIEENMNLKKTAEKLFIHYNTLRYRVEKLKEIGIDFNNGANIADISMALSINLWLNSIK